jgi:hypothetical protein
MEASMVSHNQKMRLIGTFLRTQLLQYLMKLYQTHHLNRLLPGRPPSQ